jgi:phenylpyruvate tautomerase PptA (4-oxalocrotonate tautomerase family)
MRQRSSPGVPCKRPNPPDVALSAMPTVDLTLPSGALSRSALEGLARDLSQALMHCDVARDNPRAEGMNWIYIHHQDPHNLLIGGHSQAEGGLPHYRIEVQIMAGAMTEAHRKEIAALMTAAVIRAEGGHMNLLNAALVWVIFHEVPDGHWAAGGRLYRLEDVLRFVTGNPSHPATE